MIRITLPALLLAAFASQAQAQTADTTIFAAARKAEMEAEEAIRKYAEFKPGPPYNMQECDEQIGKWCIYYEPAGKDLPKEPGKVTKARADAIVALKKAFAVAPGRAATVFPLVRLLVKDDKANEAVDAARAFLAAGDSPDAHMVLGYEMTRRMKLSTPRAPFSRRATVQMRTWCSATRCITRDTRKKRCRNSRSGWPLRRHSCATR